MLKLYQNRWVFAAVIVAALLVGAFAAPELRAFAAAVIGSADIIDGSIKSIDIGDKQVANVDLATDSVDGNKIKNGAILNPDLASNIVTSPKIKDGTILRQDMASGVLPTGATKMLYGSCVFNLSASAHRVQAGECFAPGVVIDDAIVGTINFAGDVGDYDIKLEALTTHVRDCNPCPDHDVVYWLIKNDADTAVDRDFRLNYVAFK